MIKKIPMVAGIVGLFLLFPVILFAQSGELEMSRGSIPYDLLRPHRGEAPRYPFDTVIGELGAGSASSAAYTFAQSVASALVEERLDSPALASINQSLLEGYLDVLESVNAQGFRLGSGKEEPDGAVSFLIRFIGREQAVTGELFIRHVTIRQEQEREQEQKNEEEEDEEEEDDDDDTEDVQPVFTTVSFWIFEELILEEVKDRETENMGTRHRFDFSPYERFF
ncbi:MAG: hypothetical protein FWG99_02920 [Treponema sp.]|nr:hypothetical protein [Treponema sp.]